MAVKDLTQTQANALVDPNTQRHALSGVLYPEQGKQPYWLWLLQSLKHFGDACAGWGLVKDDDAAGTTVRVNECRARLNGVTLVYAGGTISLAAYNNDTAYVYLEDDGAGNAQVTAVADATGWPSTPHMKLAEVTLASGAVTLILDRSQEYKIGVSGGDLPRYKLEVETQGDTGSASTIKITAQDVGGNAIQAVDFLRVRICDSAGYTDATNATIAAGSNTTAVETHSATKDITFQSHTDGTWRITLTDGTAETVTLRIGAAALSSRRADFSNTLNVTHAAP